MKQDRFVKIEDQLQDNYVDITGFDQILLGCFNTLNSFWLVTMNIVITDTGAYQELNTYILFLYHINDMWFAVQGQIGGPGK